jgi:hypothetical protein
MQSQNTRRWAAAGIGFVSLFVFAGCGTSTVARSASSGPAAESAGAAAASLPILGYAWDSSHGGFRAMFGVPGAARLSDSVVSKGAFTAAVLCLRKSYALLTNSVGSVYVMALPSGEPLLVTPQLANGEQVLVSPSCSKALLYAPGATTGVLISDLPSAPEVESLSFAAPGSVVGAAVGDSGDVALANLRSDGSIAIQLLPSSGTLSGPLSVLQKYGAMAFEAGSDALLVADSGANRILMVSQSSANPISIQLASPADGVSRPLAIASSADGHEAFVANGPGAPLLRLDLVTNTAPAKVPCSCTPSELVPLSGNAVFQVSELSSGTIYALDGGASAPRTVFIPASNHVMVAGASR